MTSAVQNESIAQLDVSDKWKEKFEAMEKAGLSELGYLKMLQGDKFKGMSFKERHGIQFNNWALVFGVLFYFSKGMWSKGGLILASSWLLAAVLIGLESVIEMEIPAVFYWIAPAIFCAQFANRDYYMLKVKGETVWPSVPAFFSRGAFVVCSLVLSLAAVALVSIPSNSSSHTCSSSDVKKIVFGIAQTEIAKALPPELAEKVGFELSGISQGIVNDENGKLMCSATLGMVIKGKVRPFPITYVVESQGLSQLYVTVHGL